MSERHGLTALWRFSAIFLVPNIHIRQRLRRLELEYAHIFPLTSKIIIIYSQESKYM